MSDNRRLVEDFYNRNDIEINQRLIDHFDSISDHINYCLDYSPELSDIDDREFQYQDIVKMINVNKVLLEAVKARNQVINDVAESVRKRRVG